MSKYQFKSEKNNVLLKAEGRQKKEVLSLNQSTQNFRIRIFDDPTLPPNPSPPEVPPPINEPDGTPKPPQPQPPDILDNKKSGLISVYNHVFKHFYLHTNI